MRQTNHDTDNAFAKTIYKKSPENRSKKPPTSTLPTTFNHHLFHCAIWEHSTHDISSINIIQIPENIKRKYWGKKCTKQWNVSWHVTDADDKFLDINFQHHPERLKNDQNIHKNTCEKKIWKKFNDDHINIFSDKNRTVQTLHRLNPTSYQKTFGTPNSYLDMLYPMAQLPGL